MGVLNLEPGTKGPIPKPERLLGLLPPSLTTITEPKYRITLPGLHDHGRTHRTPGEGLAWA